MQLMLAIWSRGEFFADVRERALAARDGQPLQNTHQVAIRDGVAVIPVRGPLFRHANLLCEVSGATSYETLRKDFQVALDDPQVKAILFDADSPGGDINGVNELSDAVYAARGKKPIVTYVSHLCASAMYWFGSAADRVVCAETALLGSIGVLRVMVDDSGADEKAGRKTYTIVSAQSPDKSDHPLDDKVLDRAKATATDECGIFIATVARNRGVTPERVASDFGKGDVLIGRRAVEVGLADEVGNFETTLAELAAQASAAPPAAPANPAPASAAKTRTRGGEAMHTATATKPQIKAEKPMEPGAEKKPDEVAETKMVECKHCGGDGKMPDGSKCETCGGTGKVAQKVEAAEPDKGEPEKKEHKEPDGDEAKAHAALAQMVGLKAGDTLSQIAAAATAKLVSLTKVEALRGENTALQLRVERLEEVEHRAKGETFVTKAIADGRSTEDKRPHLVGEYVKAEKAKGGSGAAALEPQLFAKGTFTVGRRMTVAGNPIGKSDQPPTSFAQDEPEEIDKAVATKVKEIAAAKKITFNAAMDLLATEAPELYAAYRALRAGIR